MARELDETEGTAGVRALYQSIHGTSFLMMMETRPLLTRNIDEARQLVSFGIKTSTVSKKNLNHTWMILSVVPRPWSSILHDPPFWRNFPGLRDNCIDPDLEFFIFSLSKKRIKLQFPTNFRCLLIMSMNEHY